MLKFLRQRHATHAITLLIALVGLLTMGQANATNASPTVSVIYPATAITLVAPATITFTVNATDSDGSIAKVELYNARNLLGIATPTTVAGQYTYTWSNIAAGTYTWITARATDNLGGINNAEAPRITVAPNTPPTVSLTATPTNAMAPASITLTANAADSDGTIAQVNFYNGTTLLTTITQAPYTTTWGNVSAGTYNLSATAIDNNGAATASTTQTVTITPAIAQAYFIQTDQLNTPRQITDSNGNVVWQWENNDPFGVTPPNSNPSGQGTFVFNQRFPGQYFDAETGLFYNRYRDYDPSTGRYIQSDLIGLGGGVNTYAYVGGRPLGYIDPLGLWATDAHDYYIDQAFPNLPPEQRDIIKEGSAYIDTPKYQGDDYSGLHAMTSRTMNKEQAMQQFCKFVKDHLARANAEKAQDDPRYLYELGMALHPVMDYTSPAHRGWQQWHGASDALKHGPWPTSEENLGVAKQEGYTKETVDLMKKALSGELPCECK